MAWRLLLGGTGMGLLVASPGLAARYDFNVASGNWGDASSWSPAGVPGLGDMVYVEVFGGNAYVTDVRATAYLQVGSDTTLHVGPGTELLVNHFESRASSLNAGALRLAGSHLSVERGGRFAGYAETSGLLEMTVGARMDAARMELRSSFLDFRMDGGSDLAVDEFRIDALTAFDQPSGKMHVGGGSTVTTTTSTFLNGEVNLTASTWTNTGTMALDSALLTLASNAVFETGDLRLASLSNVLIAVNSGSRLKVRSLNTEALRSGIIRLDGGTLEAAGDLVSHIPITLAGESTIDSGTATITAMASVAGTSLTKTGSGLLTLRASSNAINAVQIARGTVQVGSGGVLAPGTLLLGPAAGDSGVFQLSAGGILRMAGTDTLAVGAGTGTLHMNGGTLDITGPFSTAVPITLSNVSLLDTRDTTARLRGVIGGGGELQKTGTGTLYLDARNTHTGGTTMHAGTIEFRPGGMGPGRVRQLGGTLRWAEGNTDDISGQLEIGSDGGSLDLQGNNVAFASSFATSGPVTKTGPGTLSLAGPQSTMLALRLAQGTVQVGPGAALTTGSLVLGPAVGEHGVFRLETGGTLNVGGADGIRLGAGTGEFHLAGGVLKVTGSSLTTSVPMTLSNGSLLDTSGVAATLSGVLSGPGALAKTGAGTLTLGAMNTYAGGTVVFAGDLQVEGRIGAVNVQPGARLGGGGAVGAITLESGARLAPGGTLGLPGTLAGGSLLWHGGAALEFELGSGSADFLSLTGMLAKGGAGTYAFHFLDRGWQEGRTYNLVSFGSTDFQVSDFRVAAEGGPVGYFTLGGDHLQFTVVPEPATGAAAVGLFLLALAARRRAAARAGR